LFQPSTPGLGLANFAFFSQWELTKLFLVPGNIRLLLNLDKKLDEKY
jgi:hypothetical protein